jgi:predicted MPP superfamily phosphohydrolase
MKIKYVSDIHLEFYNQHKISKFVEFIEPDLECVLVLAGDIGYACSPNYNTFMKYINNNFKKVFVIAGNHEFYKQNGVEETLETLEEYFTQFDNISFLNNKIELYKGYNFIGTTLWSTITNPEYTINDTKMIKNLDIVAYNNLNKRCITFLKESIKGIENVIIITHHMPSYSLIDGKYKKGNMNNYNQWFYSDMDEFIKINREKIKCWFYGHTHSSNETRIHNIPFLCNPIGYPGENHSVDFNKVYEL